MTHQLDVERGRSIVGRWLSIAEQRLEYLTELFESDRWRRFHSELDFLENLREARAAVDTWKDLLTREASKNNSAVDLAWLGTPRTRLSLVETSREKAQTIQLQPSLAPRRDRVLAAVETPVVTPEETFSLRESDEPVPEHLSRLTLDIAAIGDRYPLLRNTL